MLHTCMASAALTEGAEGALKGLPAVWQPSERCAASRMSLREKYSASRHHAVVLEWVVDIHTSCRGKSTSTTSTSSAGDDGADDTTAQQTGYHEDWVFGTAHEYDSATETVKVAVPDLADVQWSAVVNVADHRKIRLIECADDASYALYWLCSMSSAKPVNWEVSFARDREGSHQVGVMMSP